MACYNNPKPELVSMKEVTKFIDYFSSYEMKIDLLTKARVKTLMKLVIKWHATIPKQNLTI